MTDCRLIDPDAPGEERDPQRDTWEQHEDFRARHAAVQERTDYIPFRLHTLEGFKERMARRFDRAGWQHKEI